MRHVSRTIAALATCGALAGASLSFAGPALAAEHWGALGVFGSGGSGAGQFNEPAGVAVNDETKDVYVLDQGNGRVEYFDSAGAFEGEFNGSATPSKAFGFGSVPLSGGIAVDNDVSSPSHGDVYVIDKDHDVIDKFTATGAYLGQITGTCEEAGEAPPSCHKFTAFNGLAGVAVDSKGVVWVENGVEGFVGGTLDTFTGAQPNAYITSHAAVTGGQVKPGLAVDSEDNVYLVYQGGRIVGKLNSTGELVGERLDEIEGASDVTVDPQNNDLLVDTGSSVAVLSPVSAIIESFGSGLIEGSAGVALDPAAGTSGYAYIAEPATNDVLFLEHSATSQPAPGAPATEKAEPVTATSATFHGKLDPEGTEGGVGYYFSYNSGAGSTCNGPGSVNTPLNNGGSDLTGNTAIAVSATVTGLEPRVEYVVCLVAAKYGVSDGPEKSFETLPAAPEVISESAAPVAEEEGKAVFSAVINPDHSPQETTYFFEYSTEGKTGAGEALEGTIETAAGQGTIAAEVFQNEEVLSVEKRVQETATYYYRVVATSECEPGKECKTVGKVQTYTKLPVVHSEASSGLTLTEATLEGSLIPDFKKTKYHFEYSASKLALEEHKGTPVPGGNTEGHANESEEIPVSDILGALAPNTLYYYRLVLENEVTENAANINKGKPVRGAISSFTTESLPFVSTGAAANIIRTSATLAGIVTPIDQATTYYFQYISQAAYQTALAKGAPDPYEEGETTATQILPASSEPQPVGPIAANGLLPETTYHYRLVATNKWGIEYGKDATFRTTGKLLPGAVTGGASGITQNTATLAGTVSTNGLQTSYAFEIGTEPGNYGPPTGLGSIGGELSEAVTVTLGELQPGTTYYYRVTATNADGTVQSEPATFTTPGFPSLLAAPVSPPQIAIPATAFPTDVTESATPGTKTKTKTKPKTRAQKLKAALKQCHKQPKKSRAKCERQAHSRYGPAQKKK